MLYIRLKQTYQTRIQNSNQVKLKDKTLFIQKMLKILAKNCYLMS